MVNLQVIKSSNSSYVLLGDSNRIIFSILINNMGDSKASCIRVKDLLDENIKIIPSTVKVDGVGKNALLKDMSIVVGTIEPGGNSIITYEVEVSKGCKNKTVANKAMVIYSDECKDSCEKYIEESNSVVVPIIDIDVKLRKMVDKNCVKVGEQVSYTLMLRNDSNVDIENVSISDYISEGLELNPASVYVNGVLDFSEDLEDFKLGTINAHSSIVVQFKARVLNLTDDKNIKNAATVCFEYVVIENGIEMLLTGSACSNNVFTKVVGNSLFC